MIILVTTKTLVAKPQKAEKPRQIYCQVSMSIIIYALYL